MSISRSVKKLCKYAIFFGFGFLTKCQLDANIINNRNYQIYHIKQYNSSYLFKSQNSYELIYSYESPKKEIKTQENQEKIILYRETQSINWEKV